MITEMVLYNDFVREFSKQIYDITEKGNYSDIIFLCIGTDKIAGDSFGPLVGYRLKKLMDDVYNISILGDLQRPIVSMNIRKEILKIYKNYSNPCIVAIDAALSKPQDIGKIIITKGGMHLGRSLNKTIAFIGDVSIKGVVARNYNVPKSNLKVLKTTPLNLVMEMAEVTANGIYDVIKYI